MSHLKKISSNPPIVKFFYRRKLYLKKNLKEKNVVKRFLVNKFT